MTLRSECSKKALYSQKRERPYLFTGTVDHIIGWAFSSRYTQRQFLSLQSYDILHLSTSAHRGDSWSVCSEYSLTLSSFLSAMQILFSREVLADLSIIIIATPDTKSLATFILRFVLLSSYYAAAITSLWISQPANDAQPCKCSIVEINLYVEIAHTHYSLEIQIQGASSICEIKEIYLH